MDIQRLSCLRLYHCRFNPCPTRNELSSVLVKKKKRIEINKLTNLPGINSSWAPRRWIQPR